MQICNGIDVLGGMENEPNIYLIDGEVLVDTGTGMFFADMKNDIESRYDSYKIKTIVNTHHHFDNTGASSKFRNWLKAEIMIHMNDKPYLEKGYTLAEAFNVTPRVITVDKTLKEGSVIKTKNFSFTVVHTPGHTPGSICLYEKDKRILISGDTLFESSIGRFDLPGGDRQKMFESLQKLLNYNIHYLLPGHGPPKIGGISFHIKQMIAHFGEKRFINYDFY
ncbi:MAG: MBL fold metallo-hydrolase [Candidatus Aenigmarchaeota archaeon]|nr:MBL fold metallo-hydrolase [Candidatus Aenigmarchaeota archaeon]